MTEELRVAALAVLTSTPEALRALLAPLETAAVEASADGAWSPRDVVAHLLVVERIGAIARIRAMNENDRPLLQDHDEEQELERSGYRGRRPDELLAEFEAARATDVAWLRTLDAAAFTRTGVHSEVGEVAAMEMLYHAAYHDAVHLAQLARMVGSRFEPLRGAMRAY